MVWAKLHSFYSLTRTSEMPFLPFPSSCSHDHQRSYYYILNAVIGNIFQHEQTPHGLHLGEEDIPCLQHGCTVEMYLFLIVGVIKNLIRFFQQCSLQLCWDVVYPVVFSKYASSHYLWSSYPIWSSPKLFYVYSVSCCLHWLLI